MSMTAENPKSSGQASPASLTNSPPTVSKLNFKEPLVTVVDLAKIHTKVEDPRDLPATPEPTPPPPSPSPTQSFASRSPTPPDPRSTGPQRLWKLYCPSCRKLQCTTYDTHMAQTYHSFSRCKHCDKRYSRHGAGIVYRVIGSELVHPDAEGKYPSEEEMLLLLGRNDDDEEEDKGRKENEAQEKRLSWPFYGNESFVSESQWG